MRLLKYILLFISVTTPTVAFTRHWKRHIHVSKSTLIVPNVNKMCNSDLAEVDPEMITSDEIVRVRKKIEAVSQELETVQANIANEREELFKLKEEYGSEIDRIKREYARIKERSHEEFEEASNTAKVDALKEVLPIADIFNRAKPVYQPLQTDNELLIQQTYEEAFTSLQEVIASFGVQRVESLGAPFDFNFMEAITTAPSDQYPPDTVCQEYQAGYRMGNKCVRPAMVVVSLGPGPPESVACDSNTQ